MHSQIIDNIAPARILPSPIHGFGLFASEPILAGALLAELDGQLVPWAVYAAARDMGSDAFNEWNALSPETLLVRPFRTKYSFINHSRTPNCAVLPGPSGFPRVLALAAIPEGAELVLDYRQEPLPPEYFSNPANAYL